MRTVCALLSALVIVQPLAAQATPSRALEGAWYRVEVAQRGQPTYAAQPGVRVFVDGYHTRIWLGGTSPRPQQLSPAATAAELRAVWGPVAAFGGRYEVDGQTVTEHFEVAKNPADMTGGAFARLTYRIVSDTLWLTQTETSNGVVANPQTGKYVRLRGNDAGALRGVWRHVDARNIDGTLISNQPGYRLFVDGHYGWIRVNGTGPRMQPDSAATADQLRAAWGAPGFLVSTGTYGVIGNVIVQSAVVAMNPAGMRPGNFNTYMYRISGDTLISTNLGAQAGQVGVPNVGRYVKVRRGGG